MRFLGFALAAMLAVLLSDAQAQAPLSSFKDCDQCPEMVALPPGNFLMGASKEDRKFADAYTIQSELPQHEVSIGYSFAIGRHEVTVAEFAAYVSETGARTGGEMPAQAAGVRPQSRQVHPHGEARPHRLSAGPCHHR